MTKKKCFKNVHKRIKEIRLKAGKSGPEMADAMGICRSGYRKYEAGDSLPSHEKMMLYVEQHDISLEWLLLARGPMNFSTINNAFEEVKQLKEETERLSQEKEQLKQELQKMEARIQEEKQPPLPAWAKVITEKDLAELVQFIEDTPLFKYQLLAHFHQFKKDPKNQDMPAIANLKPE